MNFSTLSQVLSNHFFWHPSRINTFAQAVISLIGTSSITLKHMAHGFDTYACLDSTVRKLQRFLKDQPIDSLVFAHLIKELLAFSKPVYVAVDRTNWDFGVFHVNFLFITVCYGKISLPIVWSLLGKKGNSNTDERKALVEEFLKVFPVEQIKCFLADREFIGQSWFNFLNDLKIPYVIRIRSDTLVKHKNGGDVRAGNLFKHLAPMESVQINNKIWGIKVKIACLKLANGELLLLASPLDISLSMLEAYADRWSIERTFLCLKTKGFNFENTHIKDNEKLFKLMAIAVLAFTLTVKAGIYRALRTPIKIKNNGRPLYSLFTYGLDLLKRLFFNRLTCKKLHNNPSLTLYSLLSS